MLASSKAQLRSSALNVRLQPLAPTSTVPSCQRNQVTPASTRDASTRAFLVSDSTPSPGCVYPKRASFILTRDVSTESSTPSTLNPTTAAPTSSTTSPPPQTTKLNWNEYLSLRKSRRRYNLFSSISTSACTTAAGVSLVNQNFEYVVTMAALDPMFAMIIATASSAAVGWLGGPILGSAVFNMLHRKVKTDMDEVSYVMLVWCWM